MNIEQTIEENKSLIKYLAYEQFDRQKIPNYFDKEDLEGYAYIGLLESIRSYKEELGFKFKTYAKHKIRGTIIDGVWGNSWKRRISKESDFFSFSIKI